MNSTPLDYKSAIQMFWSDGLKDQARKMEEEAKAKGHHIGSCHTEELLDTFITINPQMIELKNDVRALEFTNDPVLIRGETGTGKEILAQALHGSRGPYIPKDKEGKVIGIETGRFVPVNCPALSVDLMLSEFFGHVKGAFTGATSDRVGKFQYAYKGTLFIDEVGDMPLSMQAALLRVLQEGTIVRVGGNEEIEVEARLVCATNKPLEKMVEAGQFRLDLLQRINVFEIWTSSLRARVEDIPHIIKYWESMDKSKGERFPIDKYMTETAITLKGNVRELYGVYRRWKVLKKL